MIKPEQVPYDAVRAAYEAWAGGGGNSVLSAMERAIAAALNAWEGASHEQDQLGGNWHRLILPLPQEASDAEA